VASIVSYNDTLGATASYRLDAQGHVYLFQGEGATWSDPVEMVASDAEPEAKLGRAIALDCTSLPTMPRS
jgi:hypothetical protein